MRKPPCVENRVFITPDDATPAEINQALTLCRTCPMLKECATQALTSGTAPSFTRDLPATGVIQGGVWCKGDQHTAQQLAQNAQVGTPVVEPKRKFTPPEHCTTCHKPMVARQFGKPTTPGTLTHAAHGQCRICDARTRRQKNFVPRNPKHATIFEWKEKHARNNHHDPRNRGSA